MKQAEAEELRNKWGNKPCDHPKVEREFILGSHTGDYVCTQCGETFTSRPKHKQKVDTDDKKDK